ncbi:sigma 54-interacting transcriptional regulator [Myxococcota bacterium]|nr:sigma 54-interacting transcriptional regulator [Myxococcota bacterium]
MKPTADQDTKDQQQNAAREGGGSDAGDGAPVVEFAYHADLRRIGERTRADALSPKSVPVVIGRAGPLFERPDATGGDPWEDPCISRSQLSVAWDARNRVFHVGPIEGARRGLDPIAGPLPVGTRLNIEDRATLLFTRRRMAPGETRLGFVGESNVMWNVRDTLRRLAFSSKPVLVMGETGTGKELAARALHRCSGRPEDRFRALNCAALPATLIESELFGHERGAFTGAERRREGLVGEADGGTLFLDEIGDLPLEAQAKLLRFLAEGSFKRVGGTVEMPADIAVVAATHRNLPQMVEAGRFRQDLYQRIGALTVTMPPLRERREDIPLLVLACLRDAERRGLFTFEPASTRAPRIGRAFFDALTSYDWPGNVRQLHGVIERLVLFGPAAALASLSAGPAESPPRGEKKARRSRPPTADEIVEALERADFVKAKAAEALGVSRNTLDKHMRAFDLVGPMELTDERLKDSFTRHRGDREAMARELRISLRGLKLRLRLLRDPPLEPPREDD